MGKYQKYEVIETGTEPYRSWRKPANCGIPTLMRLRSL